MKYLKKTDWEKFIKPDKKHDGLLFESLIKKILELEYGDDTWHGTKGSWDGSKDFYWHTHDHRRWAECKNYKAKISLNVLSPTLVMAQIYNINDILFFSYSPIIENVREKIIQFGFVSSKNIFFYDDDALEQIILKHKDILFPEYFPKIDLSAAKMMPNPPIIKRYIIQDPLMAYQMDDDNQVFADKFNEKVDMFHLMCIMLLISNRSKEEIVVEIDLNRDDKFDLNYLELLPSDLKSNIKKITVEPFQQYIEHFYFRQVVSKKTIRFPDLGIHYHCSDGMDGQETFHFNSFISNPIRESMLWGSSYQEMLDDFDNNCFNGTKFSGRVFYGTSGTGKTRIMQECIHKSLNHHYRILQFSAYRKIYNKDETNALEIMREIILAIYEIPNIDVLDWAENEVFGIRSETAKYKIHIAFQMLRGFSSVKDKDTFFQFLEQYGEIIFERLCALKFVLVVDNVQFFNDYMIYFLSYIVRLATATQRRCSLVMIMVFNTDYFSSNSKSMDFLMTLKDLQLPFKCKRLRGFKDKAEARSFLVHLLSNNVDLAPIYLEKIIKKTGTNPYQIMQTLRWMQDTDILTMENNCCYIKNLNIFYQKIQNIPEDIEEILEDRWQYFLKEHDEKKCLYIISAIHFFEYLTEPLILLLGLDTAIIADLEKNHFLSGDITSEGYFLTFNHDTIEKFFCKYKSPLIAPIQERIKELGIDIINFPKVQRNFHVLYNNQINSTDDVYTVINSIDNAPIPLKLSAEYYLLIFNSLITVLKNTADYDEWISQVHKICPEIRDLMGSKSALNCYKRIVELSSEKKYQALSKTIAFGHFMGRYCETLNENGQYKQGYKTLKEFVDKTDFSSTDPKEDIEKKKLLCNLLNRLHVYKRHLCDDPEKDLSHLLYLERSMALSEEIKFLPINYTNYSDMGYIYYCEIKNKDKILGIWNHACQIYETGVHPQAHLNYLRKKVQVNLIQEDIDTAIDFCYAGLEYIKNGDYAYEKLYFKNWFNLALAECFLIKDPRQWSEKIEEALVNAEESDFLLETSKTFNIYYLRYLQYYYLGREELSFLFFKKAYESVHDSTYQKFKMKTLWMLVSNFAITGRNERNNYKEKLSIITYFKQQQYIENSFNMDNDNFKDFYNKYEAGSLIRSSDWKLNFPCL